MKKILKSPLVGSQFWLLNGVAASALILVLVNISMFVSNRSIQTETNVRQQYINDSIKINRLSNQLIQSLANLSAQSNDSQLKELLSVHGIQFTVDSKSSSNAQDKKGKNTSKGSK